MISRVCFSLRRTVCHSKVFMSTKDANHTSKSGAARQQRQRPRSSNKTNAMHQKPLEAVSRQPNATSWPSSQHRVVAFFSKRADAINLENHVKPYGTLTYQYLHPHKNIFIHTIEMSTSAEAEALWNAYKSKKMNDVFDVKPSDKMIIKRRHNDRSSATVKSVYEPYWDEAKLKAGIESGDVVTGALVINSKFFRHAFVQDKEGLDIVIIDLSNRNRAMTGDIVAVQINPKNEWLRGTDSDAEEEPVEGAAAKVENLSLDSKSKKSETLNKSFSTPSRGHAFKHTRKTGKVVSILEEVNSRTASGHLKLSDTGKDYMFHPVISTFPYMKILKQEVDQKLREHDVTKVMYLAKIKSWSAQHLFPIGELCECIGEMGQIEPETKRILIDYEVDFSEFSQLVEDCLPKDLPWTIPELERKKRRDFTHECIFTIDPSTARDLDDALHCKRLDDGNYEVGVHIADVSYFVKPGTELDRVASQRCTSVYMAQKVVPMLPRMLCEQLCSLNSGEERLAFSVVWTVTEKGKILSQWFGRSVIRSCAQFSYDHAQTFIDDPDRDFRSNPPDENAFPIISDGYEISTIQRKVLDLHKIAQNLRRQRRIDGALRLDQVRLAYSLDVDTGMPNGCYKYVYRQSNELIEEYMLLANIAVAHQLYKKFPEYAFLRSHSPPKEDAMQSVVTHCKALGMPLDASSSGELSRTLDICCGGDELAGCRKQALFLLAIKPQQLATYLCAGAVDNPSNFHHYALNVPLYTHFTSPIRRYPDVIVHRQLAASLGDERDMKRMSNEVDELQKQATLCNHKKMNSRMAQDASVDLFFNILVNNCGPFDCRGMVMYVRDRNFDVLSIEYGVVKRINIVDLPVLAFKITEKKITGRDLKINILKLKWPLGGRKVQPLGSSVVDYDSVGPGIEQTIEVFSLVSMRLVKKEPEDARSIKALILSPAENIQVLSETDISTTEANDKPQTSSS